MAQKPQSRVPCLRPSRRVQAAAVWQSRAPGPGQSMWHFWDVIRPLISWLFVNPKDIFLDEPALIWWAFRRDQSRSRRHVAAVEGADGHVVGRALWQGPRGRLSQPTVVRGHLLAAHGATKKGVLPAAWGSLEAVLCLAVSLDEGIVRQRVHVSAERPWAGDPAKIC